MHSCTTLLLALTLVSGLSAAGAPVSPRADTSSGIATTKPPASYALKTCIVSDEPLDSMGGSVAYTHSVPGKPDRVVWVCCEGCIDDFKKEPAKFLPKLDRAEAEAKAKKK